MPTSVYIPANTQNNIMKSTSGKIMTNNLQNINPNQITIKAMLQGVKDSDGNVYFQATDNEEPIQINMLYDNVTPRKLRNMKSFQ